MGREIYLIYNKSINKFSLNFRNLFTTSGAQSDQSIIRDVEHIVSDEMNYQLLVEYMDEEIEVFVKQMHPMKALDPYGIAPVFYQKYWKKISKNICGAIRPALQMSMFPPSLNHTHITLISKKKSREYVSNFRPISLYNVLY